MASLFSPVQRLSCLTDSREGETSLFHCLPCLPGQQPPAKCCLVAPRVLLTPFPTPKHKPQIDAYLASCEGQWMMWNVSEVAHEEFSGQTLAFVYASFPNLPLLDLCLACASIHAWLKSSPEAVALVHCQASRTRSVLLLACFLRWTFGRFFSSLQAVRSLAQGLPQELPLSPSNVRYLHYFDRVLGGGVPRFRRLWLSKVELPKAIKAGRRYVVKPGAEVVWREGVVLEEALVFTIDQEMTHDVLLRYRVSDENQRKTVFKLMFHTAFVKGVELALRKQDLDLGDGGFLFPEDAVLRLCFDANERLDDHQLTHGWKLMLQRRACDRRNHQLDQIGQRANKQKPDQVLNELFGD